MKNFNIVKNKTIFFCITAVVFLAGIICLLTQGLNWDIEFVGGTELTYNISKTVQKADEDAIENIVKDVIGEKDFSSIRVSGDNNDTVIIRTMLVAKQAQDADAEDGISEYRNKITQLIMEKYPDAQWESTNTVGGEVTYYFEKEQP